MKFEFVSLNMTKGLVLNKRKENKNTYLIQLISDEINFKFKNTLV